MVRYACSLRLLYSVSTSCFKFFNIKRIAFEIVSRILGKSRETMVNRKYTGGKEDVVGKSRKLNKLDRNIGIVVFGEM